VIDGEKLTATRQQVTPGCTDLDGIGGELNTTELTDDTPTS